MKIRKFADKRKEIAALIIISVIILLVSVYVIYLVVGLTGRVHTIFGQPRNKKDAFTHFDFTGYRDIIPKATTTPPMPGVTSSTLVTSTTTALMIAPTSSKTLSPSIMPASPSSTKP